MLVNSNLRVVNVFKELITKTAWGCEVKLDNYITPSIFGVGSNAQICILVRRLHQRQQTRHLCSPTEKAERLHLGRYNTMHY